MRPSMLADRLSAAQQPVEKFILPVNAARNKAREVIDYSAPNGLVSVVENWRQLPNGQIEFTVRHLLAAD
jgi:hypothetical protein